jgi:thioredoxin 2
MAAVFSAACPHCGNLNNIWNNAEALRAQCGLCDKDMFLGRPADTDAARFAKHVAANQIPVLAMFWLPRAGVAGSGRDINLPKYAARFEPRIRFLNINVDDNPELAQAYKVNAVPTLLFFKEGHLVRKEIGKPYRKPRNPSDIPPDPLLEWLQELTDAA